MITLTGLDRYAKPRLNCVNCLLAVVIRNPGQATRTGSARFRGAGSPRSTLWATPVPCDRGIAWKTAPQGQRRRANPRPVSPLRRYRFTHLETHAHEIPVSAATWVIGRVLQRS